MELLSIHLPTSISWWNHCCNVSKKHGWHKIVSTLAQSCPFAVNPYLLYLVQSKLCKTAAPGGLERLFSISVKVVVSILFQKARKMLNNERGEANYFSTVVFIFIAVLLLAFIIDLFSIISTKQELDHAADQMVKQIQLSGGVNGETDELFEFLSSQIEGAENISYSIDATYTSPRPSGMTNAIQLGTPFFITIEGDAKLGGFWNFDLVNITVVARGSGVSEHYWK